SSSGRGERGVLRPIRKLRSFLFVCLGCFAVSSLAGCTTQTNGQQTKVDPPKDSEITIVQPQKQTLHRTIELPGTLQAFEETPLSARIAGHVAKVNVDEGDPIKGPRLDKQGNLVSPGQALAEQSVPEMDEELKQKQALVIQATAEVDQAAAAL